MLLDLTTLNDNQRQAVEWREGPLLVLAGPGSGKTRVLTFRIANLIQESLQARFKILALTFTNKAAAEMRERIEVLAPSAKERCLLTTFHSFAADLLRQHGHYVGLKPDFTILSQEADRHSILEEAIERVRDAGADYEGTSEKLLPLVSRMVENDVAPTRALEVLQKNSLADAEPISSIYAAYRSIMIEKNTLDFSGLIAEALTLLESNPGVRKQIHRVYPYICVDEFQDTNLSQYKILRQIVDPKTRNLFVVADDDQIIYQWNGASPERLAALRKDFGMELLQLPENYRCPPSVVAIANKLIAHNFGRTAEKKALQAHKPSSQFEPISLRKFPDFKEEAKWVALDIKNRPSEARAHCVVLARTKNLLEQVIDAFSDLGLTGYLAARKNEFECASLQWLHSILRLANARGSRESLRRVCKSFFSLDGINLDVGEIASQAAAEDGDLLRGWIRAALARSELSAGARSIVEGPTKDLSEKLDFWTFIDRALRWLDQLPNAVPNDRGVFDEYKEEKGAWEQLIGEICAQYGRQEVTLHLLLQELDLRSKTPPAPKGAIPCFTIHAAKGLEFDHVYLVGLVEDQLPSWAAIKKGDSSREMQEERRNCFVAITRAQETLSLSFSDRVNGWGKNPSRFLREMGLLS